MAKKTKEKTRKPRTQRTDDISSLQPAAVTPLASSRSFESPKASVAPAASGAPITKKTKEKTRKEKKGSLLTLTLQPLQSQVA